MKEEEWGGEGDQEGGVWSCEGGGRVGRRGGQAWVLGVDVMLVWTLCLCGWMDGQIDGLYTPYSEERGELS